MLDVLQLLRTVSDWTNSLTTASHNSPLGQPPPLPQPPSQQQQQQQQQLVGRGARSALALRVARVGLQRWRGFLELLQLPEWAQAAGGAAAGAAGSGGAGSSGPSSSSSGASSAAAAKPAKPLNQKQLRQQAATAAKQQQAAVAKAAAAAAEQRREEKRREVALAAAAARRNARLKAYQRGGIPRRLCPALVADCLVYVYNVHTCRWCVAAASDSARLYVSSMAQSAGLQGSAAAAAPAAGGERHEDGGAALEGWWRAVVHYLRLIAGDPEALWATGVRLGAVLTAGELE